MDARPRQHARSSLFERERPPRLVLRFALIFSLSLAAASALILVVVRIHAVSTAERAAIDHASLVASTLLAREIRRDDLAGPVSRSRARELDGRFRPHVADAGLIALAIVRDDGVVTYSTDRSLVGLRTSSLVDEAVAGSIVSAVMRTAGRGSGSAKTLETYAPIGGGARRGAALIAQDYAPVERSARAVQLRVGAILEGLLLVLCLVFVPLLARVTGRIKRQIDTIHAQAFYDSLTGLPNRAQLGQALDLAIARAAPEDRRLAVIMLDVNRFREINDTLGHEAGNRLLEELASRLRGAADDRMLLARIGGDEFVVVAECRHESDATELARKVRATLAPPTLLDDLPLAVESTIGIALFPDHGDDAETLLKHAEIATYAAKEWRAPIVAYNPSDDPHDAEQLELVGALRDAAESGELRLHYQPKIDVATGEIVGLEALTYWEHPTRGLLSPGAFIPIAERTGVIRHVTRAVLADAVRQLREWDVYGEDLTVAVNVTAIDILDPDLPRHLDALLREHGVAPSRLCLELTERSVLAAPDRVRSVLDRIVAAGAHVSIDDFGTGHSSLAHLRNLPVHEVKIDRSFVTDMAVSANDRTIVLAAIQLAHSLGLRIVAEGVETSAVHDALRELGCDQAQGYLYGRPQPADATTALLATRDLEAA